MEKKHSLICVLIYNCKLLTCLVFICYKAIGHGKIFSKKCFRAAHVLGMQDVGFVEIGFVFASERVSLNDSISTSVVKVGKLAEYSVLKLNAAFAGLCIVNCCLPKLINLCRKIKMSWLILHPP